MGEIHNTIEKRNITIDNVGICKYKLPIIFESKNKYSLIAEIQSGTMMNKNVKGAHLSRIIEVLDFMFVNQIVNISYIDTILNTLKKQLETNNANISLMNWNYKFQVGFPMESLLERRVEMRHKKYF